jgi:hypothetical protein
MHQGGMGDVYSQSAMYGQQGMPRGPPMDMYRMQAAAAAQAQPGYAQYSSGSPFNNGSVNLTPYQRQAFGYGM